MKKISYKKAKSLLEDYLEGKTSLDEEKSLISFFQIEESLPEDLEKYRAEFAFYEISSKQDPGERVQHTLDKMMEVSTSKRLPIFTQRWYQIAAALLLMAISFYVGKGSNGQSDLQQELHALRGELVDLKETTVKVMLEGNSSHQRIQGLMLAGQIQPVPDNLLEQAFDVYKQDNNPIVKSVALEFIGLHKEKELVRSFLINALLQQELLSLQMELLLMIKDLEDKSLIEQLKLILEKEINSELKDEIEKIIQTEI